MKYNISYTGVLKRFKNCERQFYYSKIEKPKETDIVEDKWSRYGQAVHESIENHKKFETIKTACLFYHNKWKLSNTEYSLDDVVGCVEYGFEVLEEIGVPVKYHEQVINYIHNGLNFKGILDITLEDGSILDWKTSTFKTKSVNDYIKQGKFYCWLSYKTTGIVPPAFYLVFNKERKWFKYEFTLEDIAETEVEIDRTIEQIKSKQYFKDYKYNLRGCFFCPWKKKCAADSIQNLKEVVFYLRYQKNRCYIDNEFIDPMLQDVLEGVFSYEVDNAHFAIKAMRAKGNMEYDGINRLFSRKTNSVPLGLADKLIELLKGYGEHKKYKVTFEIEDKRPKIESYDHFIEIPEDIQMRQYQQRAIDEILREKVILADMCTGAGKTIIASEVIRKANQITLFVVDEKALLNQTKDVFEKLLKVPIGTITEGEMKEQPITIATVQTIASKIKSKDKAFLDYLRMVGMVIIDEAHGAKAKSYKMLVDKVNSRYIIGLTGTAYADGNSSLELYRTFGYPKINIKARELIDEGYLTEPDIIFHKYEQDELILEGEYNEMYDQIVLSKRRFNKIIDIVKEHNNDSVLIIVNRLDHMDKISEELTKIGISNAIIKGEIKAKERTEILNQMRNAEIKVVIGTSKIVQKGLDIPNLNVIINVTANLGSIFSIQSLGRILRKSDGKEKAYYHDFYDENDALISHTKARISYFENEGYDLKFKEITDYSE